MIRLASLITHQKRQKRKPECNPHQRFRTMDGKCNNLENPEWGAAMTAFQRMEGPDYGDLLSEPQKSQANKPLTTARSVSRVVHGSKADGADPEGKTPEFSHLAMNWGQFLDLDIALATGMNCEPTNVDPECIDKETPHEDFIREEIDVRLETSYL